MTSNDKQQFLTAETFNYRMDNLATQIQLGNEKLRSELRSEFQAGFTTLQTQTQVNAAKIEMLQHTFYWGFGIMTLVITIVAILVPYLLLIRKEKKQERPQAQHFATQDEVKDLISKALSDFRLAGK